MTVIVPVFNTVEYVVEAVRSVLTQRDIEVELVVVDDSSTDGSLEAVRAHVDADSRARVMVQPVNQGQSAARNLGMSVARGRYILFLDSDDALVEDAASILVRRADETGADIAYFDASTVLSMADAPYTLEQYDAFYSRSRDYRAPRSGRELLLEMLEHDDWRPSACLQLLRTEWLVESSIVFPVGLIHEDNQFSGEAALRAGRVVHLPQPLYRRRIRAGSTTTMVPGPEHFRSLLEIARHFDESASGSTGLDRTLRERLRDRMLADAGVARSRSRSQLETDPESSVVSRRWFAPLRALGRRSR